MNFRRKSPRTGLVRRTKLETRAHAARSFKRVTRQWELALNVKCQVVQNDPGPDCANGGVIYLVAPGFLQGAAIAALGGNLNDAVRIRRIEGNIYFKPENSLLTGTSFSNCVNVVADNANHNVFMRMGLKKVEAPQVNSGVSPGWNPMNNGATPFELSDYADGQWMKMWEHLWPSKGSVTSGASNNFSCCSVQAGYVVPETVEGEQVTYNVPPIVCQPCGDVEDPATDFNCSFSVQTHDWWKARIHVGRTIVLKEAESLGLYFGWERLRDVADPARLTQPAMKWFGGVRLLLES